MNIKTSNSNKYSYLRQTNEIVPGVVDDDGFVWKFAPYLNFSSMPEVRMFIIALTEQCNLRCTYCCYSGIYPGNHSHSTHSLCEGDIDLIYSFIDRMVEDKPFRISFYGGEPIVKYHLVKYAVKKGYDRWKDKVTFAISTNGTLLTPEIMTWLVNNEIEIAISIDGTGKFHDRYRIDAGGNGSFSKVYNALEYLYDSSFQKNPVVVLMLTLSSISDIGEIAKEWQEDPLLRYHPPTHITGLTPNFSCGVLKDDWDKLRNSYLSILDLFQQHPDWVVLQTFFEELTEIWKNRPIFQIDGEVPLPTCMPVNTKLYIDSKLQIAVCEKINDRFRIGTVSQGVDWAKANDLARTYYDRRVKRCANCVSARVCDQCLTAVSYTDDQWDILCYNERMNHRLEMLIFCEMVERGMLETTAVPKLETAHCKLNAIDDTDVPALRVIFSDESTKTFLPELCDVVKSDDGIRQVIKSFATYLKSEEGYLWGIRYDESLVGFIAIMDIPENSTIFYAMNARYRGKGLMTECASEVVKWFRETHPSCELHSEIHKGNVTSVRILNNAGFHQYNEDKSKVYLKLAID